MANRVRYYPVQISSPIARQCGERGCEVRIVPKYTHPGFILSRDVKRDIPARTYERVFCSREHQLAYFRRVVLHERSEVT